MCNCLVYRIRVSVFGPRFLAYELTQYFTRSSYYSGLSDYNLEKREPSVCSRLVRYAECTCVGLLPTMCTLADYRIS